MKVTVGERLKVALRDKYMTQKQLAEKMHVSESTVQKWCTDKNAIPADKLVDVSCALGISVLTLLGLNADDIDCEEREIAQLRPSRYVFEECPPCQEYQLELALQYMMLEHYKLEDDITEEEIVALKNEQQDILTSEIGTNTDEVISVMRELDKQGRLFERVTVKENKYERAMTYVVSEFVDWLQSMDTDTFLKCWFSSVSVDKPFCR